MAGRDIADQRFKGWKVGDVELNGFNRAALRFNMRARNIELLLTASANHDLCPTADQQCCRCQANSVAAARDNRNLARQILSHSSTSHSNFHAFDVLPSLVST